MARLMLRHFNIDPDTEIKFLATGPLDSRFGAMKQGFTVATLGSPPIEFVGKKLGFVVLARAEELFSYPSSGLIVNAKKIKERPDEIKRTIKARHQGQPVYSSESRGHTANHGGVDEDR